MVKFIKHVKVYPFSELSEEAKEEAKRWYLNDETRCNDLTLYYESDIGCIFPNSDLKNLAAHSRDFSHELAASLNSLFQ